MSRQTASSLFSSSAGASSLSRKSAISLAFNGAANPAGPYLPIRDRLAARSRVTNLGVVLLLVAIAFSAMLNLHYLLAGAASSKPPKGFGSWTSYHGTTPDELKASLPPPPPGSNNLDHLVIVVGHAVWAGCDFKGRSKDENWILESFQQGGSVNTFWKHIEKGLEIADADPKSLLIFSGGQTRSVSLQTEAESYFSLAISSGINIPVLPGFDFTLDGNGSAAAGLKKAPISASSQDVLGKGAHANAGVPTAKGLLGVRMTTENFALDSYQNLLFSIARFREYTGSYPERITVIGYGMKKSRFEELHAKAVRWPAKSFSRGQKRFHYVGIDDEGDTKPEYDGEKIKGFSLFERDMYGCHGKLLEKRRTRNPTRRLHPYYSSAPEIADLLNWCPADGLGLQGIYRDSLPWDLRDSRELSGWGRATDKFREEHGANWVGVPDSRWLGFGREQ